MTQDIRPLPVAALPEGGQRRSRRWMLWAFFLVVVVFLFAVMSQNRAGYVRMPLSEFRQRLQAGEMSWVTITGDQIGGELRQPLSTATGQETYFRTDLPPGISQNWMFVQWLLENSRGARVDAENSQNLLLTILVPLIPWVLIFGFIWLFVFRRLRKAGQQPTEPMRVVVVGRELGE